MTSSTPPLGADTGRAPVIARPDDPGLRHLAVVGDTYTILVAGRDTDGRYALIDMTVPPGGGPPPHRHAFEELFHVLEGELEVTIRGETRTAVAGESVNVPGGARHTFRNAGSAPVRMLTFVAPAGLEELFAEVGDPVDSRTAPAPALTDEERGARLAIAKERAAHYGMEI